MHNLSCCKITAVISGILSGASPPKKKKKTKQLKAYQLNTLWVNSFICQEVQIDFKLYIITINS